MENHLSSGKCLVSAEIVKRRKECREGRKKRRLDKEERRNKSNPSINPASDFFRTF